MGSVAVNNNGEIFLIYREAKRILKLLQSIEKNAANYALIIEGLKADARGLGGEKPKVLKLVADMEKRTGEVKLLNTKIHSLVSDTQKIKNGADDVLVVLKNNSKTSTDFVEKTKRLKTELEEIKKNITSFSVESHKNSLKIQTFLLQAEKNGVVGKDILKFLKEAETNAKKTQSDLAEIAVRGREDFKKITNSKKEVESLQLSSKKLVDSIQKYYQDLFRTDGTRETIADIERNIKANQSLIDQQLKNASANRLCGVLEEHGTTLKITRDNWGKVIFIIVVVILIFNTLPIIKIPPISDHININSGNFWGIELTLSFVLIFSTLQYSSTKKQYGEYVFKYIAAFSLPAYLELLEDGPQEIYAKFLTDTVGEIYRKPENDSKDNLVEHIFDIFKSFFSKKIDLNSIIKDISDERIDEFVKLVKSKL